MPNLRKDIIQESNRSKKKPILFTKASSKIKSKVNCSPSPLNRNTLYKKRKSAQSVTHKFIKADAINLIKRSKGKRKINCFAEKQRKKSLPISLNLRNDKSKSKLKVPKTPKILVKADFHTSENKCKILKHSMYMNNIRK